MKRIVKCIALVLVLSLTVIPAFAAENRTLIPGGHTIGLKAYSKGLMVTGVDHGSPAQKAGIRKGDILNKLDKVPLQTAKQLVDELSSGSQVQLELSRGKSCRTVCVTPEKVDGGYRLGAYVRESVAGIGTVTYYDPATGEFGSLGHGISDLTGSALLPVTGGEVIPSRVSGVVKGVSGTAGQLKGEFDPNTTIGVIVKNTSSGLFGRMSSIQGQEMEVARTGEIRAGKATILSNVVGDEIHTYDIQIVKCYDAHASDGRNMLIRITDRSLLDITGGIVQGMSGSPIIQNGKLVGAVTHVLVNDPTMGYGIYMDNMLSAAA